MIKQINKLDILADIFFLWILYQYGMGGWKYAILLFQAYGIPAWMMISLVVFLLLYKSDWRIDLPLFVAGFGLGYWGEWWGTTRGIWTYWNGATPPDYLPPLWGIGVLTVYRSSQLVLPLLKRELPRWLSILMAGSFFVLPFLAFTRSWPILMAVDWRGRLDIHFYLGILLALVLILPGFDLRSTFLIYLFGILLGGLYETLGTSFGEWTYITREMPPLWIAPLWGLAACAMTRLALYIRSAVEFTVQHTKIYVNLISNWSKSVRID